MKRQQSDTPPTDVDQWTKRKCEEFLRTIKGAKLSGSKSELISRVKGHVEHPEILNSIQNAPEITLTTALNSNDIDESSALHWTSAKENLPCLTVNGLESYVKTRKKAAQALQEKGYRIFASRKIVSVKTSVVHANKLLKAFVRPSMESKAARPLWILFSEDKPTKAFCRCPAGKSGLCCHVSAVLYALEEHSRTGNLTLEIACTSKLQTYGTKINHGGESLYCNR
jgi:hypothetical protein